MVIPVRVFTDLRNDEHDDACIAFFDGLRHLGVRAAFNDVRDGYAECEVAVVFGVHKHRVPQSYERGAIIAAHRQAGRDVIIIEKGYVLRDSYYACGWNGLNGRADFRNADAPSDRAEALLARDASILEKHDGDNIVVMGQLPWDASVQHTDHVGWCRETIEAIRRRAVYDGRGLVFRPHPLAHGAYSMWFERYMLTKPRGLGEELANAGLVVTFNSNTAVDAALAGCRVVAMDEGSMLWGSGFEHRALPDIIHGEVNNPPALGERLPWLYRLAYCQWTLDEMAVGLPFQHLTRGTP